jgi:uncharacterized protein (TIGR02452 family)
MERLAQANKAMYNELAGSRGMVGGGEFDWIANGGTPPRGNSADGDTNELRRTFHAFNRSVGEQLSRWGTTSQNEPTSRLALEDKQPERKADAGAVRLYVVTAPGRARVSDAGEVEHKVEHKVEREQGTENASLRQVPALEVVTMTPKNENTKAQGAEIDDVQQYDNPLENETPKEHRARKRRINKNIYRVHEQEYKQQQQQQPYDPPHTIRIDVDDKLGHLPRLPPRTSPIKVTLYNGTADQAITDIMDLYNNNVELFVVNLANASKPCGGYKNGQVAQEESLCRSSHVLSVSLDNAQTEGYYDQENWTNYNWSKTVLYTPDVRFEYYDDRRYFTQRERAVHVNVITAAFPHIEDNDRGWLGRAEHYDWRGPANRKNHDNVLETIGRIPEILPLEKQPNIPRVLIMGAIGCGVYAPDDKELKTKYRGFVAERIKTFFDMFETRNIWDEVYIAITGENDAVGEIITIFTDKFKGAHSVKQETETVWNSISWTPQPSRSP